MLCYVMLTNKTCQSCQTCIIVTLFYLRPTWPVFWPNMCTTSYFLVCNNHLQKVDKHHIRWEILINNTFPQGGHTSKGGLQCITTPKPYTTRPHLPIPSSPHSLVPYASKWHSLKVDSLLLPSLESLHSSVLVILAIKHKVAQLVCNQHDKQHERKCT